MDTLLKSLRKQLQYSLKVPEFGEPKFLLKQKVELEKKYDVGPQEPKATDIDELCAKVNMLWVQKGKKGLELLNSKDIKWLPWVLYHGDSPKIIEKQKLLQTILEILQKRWKRTLNSLIHVYLKYYDPSFSGTKMLGETIYEQLTIYEKNNAQIQKWKNRIILFSAAGPGITASWIVKKNKDVAASLDHLGLTGDLSTSGFLKHMVFEAIKMIEKTFPEHLQKLRPLMEMEEPQDIYTSKSFMVRFPELISEAATRLLPKAGTSAPSHIQDALRPFFLNHLGDPRLPGGSTKWKRVSDEAVKVFKQWLSKKDLEFFFNLVEMSNLDPKWIYRRRFWEAYIGYFENTWVALGPRALSLVSNPKMKKHLEERNFGTLSGNSLQSIFFIQMGGYVFVEWSSSGGACRVWHKDRFPLQFGQQKYSASSITRPKVHYDYRQVHSSSELYRWQDTLAGWIQRNTGIKPDKSYYVE